MINLFRYIVEAITGQVVWEPQTDGDRIMSSKASEIGCYVVLLVMCVLLCYCVTCCNTQGDACGSPTAIYSFLQHELTRFLPSPLCPFYPPITFPLSPSYYPLTGTDVARPCGRGQGGSYCLWGIPFCRDDER